MSANPHSSVRKRRFRTVSDISKIITDRLNTNSVKHENATINKIAEEQPGLLEDDHPLMNQTFTAGFDPGGASPFVGG